MCYSIGSVFYWLHNKKRQPILVKTIFDGSFAAFMMNDHNNVTIESIWSTLLAVLESKQY